TSGARCVSTQETMNPFQATLWGMAKSVAREHPELNSVCLDLDPGCMNIQWMAQGILNELWSLDKEGYLAIRGPNRHIYRLHRQDLSHNLLTYPSTSCYRLVKGKTLDELTLEVLPHVSLQPGQLEVTVKAAGLNFRDVLKAMDLNPWETTDVLGSDCAG